MALNQLTEVRLLAAPLEKDYKHTLYFANASAQASYFTGLTKFSAADYSYQRKEGYIRYPMHFDDLRGCNYLMFINSPYSTKWYYAFITRMEYKNDETTFIYFEIDVIQTYLFDYTFKPSFIEREHVADDTIGKHTFPENLETGEYVCNFYLKDTELQDVNIVVAVTDEIDDDKTVTGGRYTGTYSGMKYYSFLPTSVQKLNDFITAYDKAGKGEAINSMFIAPYFLSTTISTDDRSVKESASVASIDSIGIDKSAVYAGKTIKNNKLKTYPFCYLLVSNNNGGSAIYQLEHFKNNRIYFQIKGVLSPGCSIRLTPEEYKGVDLNEEEGLNLGKYPICNWTSDVYINWLTQNSVNIATNLTAGLGQVIGGGLASLTGIGMIGGIPAIGSGLASIANQIGQIHQMSFTPPQAKGNTNNGDIITASHNNTFTFYGMMIKDEYIDIIDGFFTMFGYKINKVKIPETNHRKAFWFTKTIDANIDGAIPQEEMQKIKDCYNNGITFWKSASSIGDYSVDNSTV